MSNPVRFAIIGAGSYGSSRLEVAAQASTAQPGSVQLVAVADSDPQRAQAAGERFGIDWETDYGKLLERDDIDVVGVFTPSGLHRDVGVAVASAGKHLLMTKPIEVTLERADAIISACEANGVRIFSEFYLRYMKDNFRIHEAISAGALGQLILGDFSYKCYRPQWYYENDGGWRGTYALNGGGIIMNQTIHAIDKLRWYLGEVASVQALMGTYTHKIEVEDTASALMEMRNGAQAVLIGTATFHNDRPVHPDYGGGSTSRSEVNGDKGSAIAIDNKVTMWVTESGETFEDAESPANVFVDIALSLQDPARQSPTLVTGRDARASLEVALAIYESARTRRPVEVTGA
jgi:UDP-N-acetyl-2-amino-2-deoxyglucuronate dehydrogenase